MSIPAMREIRRLFPAAHITLLVNPWVSPIYAEVEFIDEILQYDKHGIHKGWAGFGRLVSDLRRRNFDLAILLQNAFEAALIACCARIPIRVGYARDGRRLLLTHACKIHPGVRQVHQVYYYLGILSSLGCWRPASGNGKIANFQSASESAKATGTPHWQCCGRMESMKAILWLPSIQELLWRSQALVPGPLCRCRRCSGRQLWSANFNLRRFQPIRKRRRELRRICRPDR